MFSFSSGCVHIMNYVTCPFSSIFVQHMFLPSMCLHKNGTALGCPKTSPAVGCRIGRLVSRTSGKPLLFWHSAPRRRCSYTSHVLHVFSSYSWASKKNSQCFLWLFQPKQTQKNLQFLQKSATVYRFFFNFLQDQIVQMSLLSKAIKDSSTGCLTRLCQYLHSFSSRWVENETESKVDVDLQVLQNLSSLKRA